MLSTRLRVGPRATNWSSVRLSRTRSSSDRVARDEQSVPAPLVADAVEEGLNVILSMLVVGLVFLAVILLGDLNDWFARRRFRRHG